MAGSRARPKPEVEVATPLPGEILRACRVTSSEALDLPDWSEDGHAYESVTKELTRAAATLRKGGRRPAPAFAWDELRPSRESFQHHLLGYSVHSRTSEPSPGKDWVHLLCLGSEDENVPWNWCDGEHLSIFVHEDDARDGTWRRVHGYAS